ncbi:DnaJ (Hsp40) [Gurleya vavrai]
MKITLYQKFNGIYKKIEDNYYESRLITSRYTPKDLLNWKKLDLYFILGIESLKDFLLDESLLTEQYRKQILKYHPDVTKYSQEVFLVIQRAYNTLKNPVMRLKYDSIILDENIPEDKEYTEKEFFVVFEPVFFRNNKFSKSVPIPLFGNENTKLEQVETFYKFWQNFESLRSFEFLDEEDYETMNRDERKYREKKNKAAWEKLRREDILRIKQLVTIAIKRDPRLNVLRKKNVTKKLSQMSIKVNPKLLKNGWEEKETLNLYNLIIKSKNKENVDWDNVFNNFSNNDDKKRSQKEIIIKGNEILRMGIK